MTRLMFISEQKPWVFRIAFFTSLLALAVILLSTYTHGINMPTSRTIRIQRYLFESLGLLILMLTFITFYLRQYLTNKPFTICLGLMLLAGCQFALNKYSFPEHFLPFIVLLRLLIDIIALSCLWWISQITRPNAYSFKNSVSNMIRLGAWLGFIVIFLQITLGTWISSNYAGFMCSDFPYCHGQLFPMIDLQHLYSNWLTVKKIDDEFLTALNSLHRASAIVMGIYIGIFSLLLFLNRQLMLFGVFFLLLLAVQVAIGIFNIVPTDSIFLAISHNTITGILLLTIISLLINLYRKPQDYWYS